MKNFERILALLKKTGDRYIFEDQNGNVFIILGIEDYENLVLKNSQVKGLSEDELLNKINKDIAVWKSIQEDEQVERVAVDFKKQEQKPEDHYYFEPVEDEE